jgi:hypothetical protein
VFARSIIWLPYQGTQTSSPDTTNQIGFRRHAKRVYSWILFADFLLRQFGKDAVLVTCAEIDIDAPDLVAFEAEELGIAKAPAVFGQAPVGYKGIAALNQDFLELVPFDPVAAAPASRKVGGLVDLIVIRTGKAEILPSENPQRACGRSRGRRQRRRG